MQTFLSEPTFHDSVVVLDNKRLNKQLLEGYQILKAISLTPAGGGSRVDGKVPFASNHPATNQWRGKEGVLLEYLCKVRAECEHRGIKWDKNWNNIDNLVKENKHFTDTVGLDRPAWWTDPVANYRVMLTHRYNLYKKDPVHYARYLADAEEVALTINSLVCCATHAPYYYPSHDKAMYSG